MKKIVIILMINFFLFSSMDLYSLGVQGLSAPGMKKAVLNLKNEIELNKTNTKRFSQGTSNTNNTGENSTRRNSTRVNILEEYLKVNFDDNVQYNAIKFSNEIKENVGKSNSKALLSLLYQLEQIDCLKVNQSYNVVINLLTSLELSVGRDIDSIIINKIVSFVRKYLYAMYVSRLSGKSNYAKGDLIRKSLNTLEKRYEGDFKQYHIYYEIYMIKAQNMFLDSIMEREESKEMRKQIAELFLQSITKTVSSAIGNGLRSTGVMPCAPEWPILHVVEGLKKIAFLTKANKLKKKLMAGYKKWNEIDSLEKGINFSKILKKINVLTEKDSWMVYYKSVYAIYKIIINTKNNNTRISAFNKLRTFLKFDKFKHTFKKKKFHNDNLRVILKTVECLILLENQEGDRFAEIRKNAKQELESIENKLNAKNIDKSEKTEDILYLKDSKNKEIIKSLIDKENKPKILLNETSLLNSKTVKDFVENYILKNGDELTKIRFEWEQRLERENKERNNEQDIDLKVKGSSSFSESLAFKAEEFLKSKNKKVLVLSGNAGSGKTTFAGGNKISKLCRENGYTPVFIKLSQLKDPVKNLTQEYFEKIGVEAASVKNEKLLFVLDGYDELSKENQEKIYKSNSLEQWEKSKFIFTVRYDMLDENRKDNLKFEEDISEIVKIEPVYTGKEDNDYKEVLNNFVLEKMLSYEFKGNYSSYKQVWDRVFKKWFEYELKKLETAGKKGNMNIDDYYHYVQKIACYLKEKDKNEFSFYKQYKYSADKTDWEIIFEDEIYNKDDAYKIFHAMPIKKTENGNYVFLNDNIQQYFLNKEIEYLVKSSEKDKTAKIIKIISSGIVDKDLLEFMMYSAKESKEYRDVMFEIIAESKTNKNIGFAASNAITVLNYANVSFTGMDFSGIKISNADLFLGKFVNINFKGAKLNNVNLRETYFSGTDLSQVDFTGSNMKDIEFKEIDLSVLTENCQDNVSKKRKSVGQGSKIQNTFKKKNRNAGTFAFIDVIVDNPMASGYKSVAKNNNKQATKTSFSLNGAVLKNVNNLDENLKSAMLKVGANSA